jgi:hypothetical protein
MTAKSAVFFYQMMAYHLVKRFAYGYQKSIFKMNINAIFF